MGYTILMLSFDSLQDAYGLIYPSHEGVVFPDFTYLSNKEGILDLEIYTLPTDVEINKLNLNYSGLSVSSSNTMNFVNNYLALELTKYKLMNHLSLYSNNSIRFSNSTSNVENKQKTYTHIYTDPSIINASQFEKIYLESRQTFYLSGDPLLQAQHFFGGFLDSDSSDKDTKYIPTLQSLNVLLKGFITKMEGYSNIYGQYFEVKDLSHYQNTYMFLNLVKEFTYFKNPLKYFDITFHNFQHDDITGDSMFILNQYLSDFLDPLNIRVLFNAANLDVLLNLYLLKNEAEKIYGPSSLLK